MNKIEQASEWIKKANISIEGKGGSQVAMSIAWNLTQRFGLSKEEAKPIMMGWNTYCQPPWSEKEIDHKLDDAKNNSCNPVTQKSNSYREIAVYTYTDHLGNVVFRKIRFANEKKQKNFTIEPKGAVSKYPYLYNFYNVYKVMQSEGEVLLVEGEKDADTGNGLGFTTTTDPCGAKGWKEVFARQLLNTNVSIIADRDAVGFEAAANRCESLFEFAKSVKIIELPGEGKDLTEWVEQNSKLDHKSVLQQVIADTPSFNKEMLESYRKEHCDFKTLPTLEEDEEKEKKKPAKKLHAISYQDFKNEPIKPVEWLVDGIIADKDFFIFSGKSKSGKSTYLVNLAVCLACGVPFVDRYCKKSKVLLVAIEDKDCTVKNRIQMLSEKMGVDPGDNLQCVFRDEFLDAGDEKSYFAMIKDLLEENTKEADSGNPYTKWDVVIIDPYYYLAEAIDENNIKEMGELVKKIRKLGAKNRCGIIMSTHIKKGSIKDLEPTETPCGSSVTGRIGESLLALYPHEKTGLNIVKWIVRVGKQSEPEVWGITDFPIVKKFPEEDPTAYRETAQNPFGGRPSLVDADELLIVLNDFHGKITRDDFIKEAKERYGVSKRTFERLIYQLKQQQKIVYNNFDKTYNNLQSTYDEKH